MNVISNAKNQSVSASELGQLYRSNKLQSAKIIDVRTPVEYQEKHIEGSTPLPLDSLSKQVIDEINQNTTEPLYLLCHSGMRAKKCLKKMQDLGFDNGVLVEGGILAWEKENLPLSHGKKAISLERQVRIAAGMLVFSGSLLAWLIHPAWLALPAAVGAGLIFAGITDTCGMGLLLARMPWNK